MTSTPEDAAALLSAMILDNHKEPSPEISPAQSATSPRPSDSASNQPTNSAQPTIHISPPTLLRSVAILLPGFAQRLVELPDQCDEQSASPLATLPSEVFHLLISRGELGPESIDTLKGTCRLLRLRLNTLAWHVLYLARQQMGLRQVVNLTGHLLGLMKEAKYHTSTVGGVVIKPTVSEKITLDDISRLVSLLDDYTSEMLSLCPFILSLAVDLSSVAPSSVIMEKLGKQVLRMHRIRVLQLTGFSVTDPHTPLFSSQPTNGERISLRPENMMIRTGRCKTLPLLFTNLDRLSSLTLIASGMPSLYDGWVPAFSRIITEGVHLHSLTLNGPIDAMQAKQLRSCFTGGKMKALRNLSLTHVFDKAVFDPLLDGLSHMQLKFLCLTSSILFEDSPWGITPYRLHMLAHALPNLEFLTIRRTLPIFPTATIVSLANLRRWMGALIGFHSLKHLKIPLFIPEVPYPVDNLPRHGPFTLLNGATIKTVQGHTIPHFVGYESLVAFTFEFLSFRHAMSNSPKFGIGYVLPDWFFGRPSTMIFSRNGNVPVAIPPKGPKRVEKYSVLGPEIVVHRAMWLSK